MTKTKSQKARAKLNKMGIEGFKQQLNKKKSQQKLMKDWNFLNGNSFSFLNNAASLGGGMKGLPNLGKQKVRRLKVPVAKSFAGLSAKALITTMNSGTTRVKHSEYVKDVVGSMDFEGEGFPINPGVSELFPWLSSIAKRYESYQFKNLKFRFETTSPTSTAGSVILTVDYNPDGQVPNSKVEALAMESAVRTPPWGSVEHVSLGHNLTKRKSYYVRNNKSGVEKDLYDTGLFSMMVEGVPTETGSIGEMYVDYEIDLITPILTADVDSTGGTGDIEGGTDLGGTARVPFEVDIEYKPTSLGSIFQVGPTVLSAVRQPAVGGEVGAVRFTDNGKWMFLFKFNSPTGELNGTNFAFGASDQFGQVPEAFEALKLTNLTPGPNVAMTDGTGENAMVLLSVEFDNSLSPYFSEPVEMKVGVGSKDVITSPITATLHISNYDDPDVAFSAALSKKFSQLKLRNNNKKEFKFSNSRHSRRPLDIVGDELKEKVVEVLAPKHEQDLIEPRYCDLVARGNPSGETPECGRFGCYRCHGVVSEKHTHTVTKRCNSTGFQHPYCSNEASDGAVPRTTLNATGNATTSSRTPTPLKE